MLALKRAGKTITVTLPCGNKVTIGAYVRAWKRLLSNDDDSQTFNGWGLFPMTADEILLDIRQGVHDRINRHLPWFKFINQ